METFNEIIDSILAPLARFGIDTGVALWNIVTRGVRAEGIAILLLAIVSCGLVALAVRGLISALPDYSKHVHIVKALTKVIVAATIFHLKDAIVMVIAPDYFLLKTGALAALNRNSAQVVVAQATSNLDPVYPFVLIGLSIVAVLIVSLRRKNRYAPGVKP